MKPVLRLLLLFLALLMAGCQEQREDLMVGTLERYRIELKAESNEPIVTLHVADGERVEPGDPIASQDPRRHQARLDFAEAQSEQAAARLAELRRGPREEAIREARARLAASSALTRDAAADLERVREIYRKGLSTESALDNAQARFDSSQAAEQANREALAGLLNGTTVEELLQAEAALEAARAAERETRLTLERLELAAPVSGRIDRVLYRLGERPTPGTTVAVLLDGARSYARVYVPEHLKAHATVGTQLPVWIDGIDHSFTGTVRWVSADASFTPYFALTEHDRSRLSYLAELDLEGADDLPVGLPLEVRPPDAATGN